MLNLPLMTPDSTGFLDVAVMAFTIPGLGASRQTLSISERVASVQSTPHDTGFDWFSSCDPGDVENLWLGSLSSATLYQTGLYVFNLPLMTPDSIGFLAVARVALRISGLGASHLPLSIRAGCKCSIYPS